MQAIEFSTQITADKRLVIPATILPQVAVGTKVHVVIMFEAIVNLDVELLTLVQQIQANPTPIEMIKRPTETITQEELIQLLQADNPTFDVDEWNTEWDTHENETRQKTHKDTRAMLEDVANLAK